MVVVEEEEVSHWPELNEPQLAELQGHSQRTPSTWHTSPPRLYLPSPGKTAHHLRSQFYTLNT